MIKKKKKKKKKKFIFFFFFLFLSRAISESIRDFVQTSLSLEALAIREEQLTEQSFSWDVPSAIGEFRTNVSFYLSQNKQVRTLAQHDGKRGSFGVSLGSRRLGGVPSNLLGPNAAFLAKVDLSCNCMTSLSELIVRLENLTFLDVSCNQLSVLPPQLHQLTKLQHLNVAHNELVELSDGVGFLQNLSFLNVSSNRLRDLPLSLGCMPNLREAILHDQAYPTNKFRFPSEVMEGGSLSILTHLKHLLKRKQRYPVCSVFFVGTAVPKTRLLHMLSREDGSKLASTHASSPSYIGRNRKTSQDASSVGVLGKFYSRSGGNLSLSSQSSDTNSSDSEHSGDDSMSVETTLFRWQLNRSDTGGMDFAPNNVSSPNQTISQVQIASPRKLLSSSGNASSGSNVVNINSMVGDGVDVSNEMQLEVWDFSGFELVPLFQRQNTAFVVCVNVASDRFSVASVIKSIHRIQKFSGTRIMLFGSYPEGSLPPANLAAVEAELDRVIAMFSGLIVSKFLVSSKSAESKSSRKVLRDMVLKLVSEMWAARPEVPSSWIVFGRMLVMKGQALSVPVLTWEQIMAIAAGCGLTDQATVEAASKFVSETGHITFSEAPGEDWVVLNTTWMSTMWSPLRLLHSKPEIKGLVSADELVQAWQSTCLCPTWATRPWIALLKRLKMVIPIPQLRLILVPNLLAPERPSDLESRFWPAHCLADQMQYSRVFTLSEPFPDELLISQMAIRLLRANWNCEIIWLSGLVMSLGEERLLVECNALSTVVKMSVRAPGVSSQLITLIFWMTSIIAEQMSSVPTVEVPCIHCMQLRSYDPYMFSRAELEDAVASGKGVVLCRSVNPILIHSMAPDISMAGIAAHVIEPESLGELTLIGEGGFAKVIIMFIFVCFLTIRQSFFRKGVSREMARR